MRQRGAFLAKEHSGPGLLDYLLNVSLSEKGKGVIRSGEKGPGFITSAIADLFSDNQTRVVRAMQRGEGVIGVMGS